MFLDSLLSLYRNQDVLLNSDQFGEGLWAVDPELGQFMHYLIRFFHLKRGLELGAGVGYSTGFLVHAFQQTQGFLTCLEYFYPKVLQWERHMITLFGSQQSQTVEIVPSDIRKWLAHSGRQKFDFVFFDQRKGEYLSHLQLLIPKLRKGAFICADNVLSHQKSCQNYLTFVRNDKRFQSTCLSFGAGLEVSRYMG